MANVIEQHLLARGGFKKSGVSQQRIVQGYLCSHPDRTVMIHLLDDEALISVKSPDSSGAMPRFEWVRGISVEDARAMLALCEPGVIDKAHNLTTADGHASDEIERKFLTRGDFWKYAVSQQRIAQGYLCSHPARTVRIRLRDDKAFMTVKGPGNASGTTRYEWEIAIPVEDATAMLALCEPGVIDKTRHLIPCGVHTFEVDVFHGENEGLILAEIELATEGEAHERPEWLGEEVTGDARYYNSSLAKSPYSTWTT